MKTTFRFAGWLALAALIIFGTAATYQTGSPFPRLADTTGNPIRVGAGLNITNRWLYATGTGGGGTGSVSSVGLTMPGGFSVSGSPVTTSGTLAVTTALTNIIKGTGSGFSNAVAGVDYQLPGNYITAFSGAVVGFGPGTATTTLASTGVTNGVYGSATMVPQINVGSNGLILGATNIPISGGSTPQLYVVTDEADRFSLVGLKNGDTVKQGYDLTSWLLMNSNESSNVLGWGSLGTAYIEIYSGGSVNPDSAGTFTDAGDEIHIQPGNRVLVGVTGPTSINITSGALDGTFTNLNFIARDLVSIDLGDNSLTEFDTTGLTNTISLSLTTNPLTSLDTTDLIADTYLDISDTLVEEFNGNQMIALSTLIINGIPQQTLTNFTSGTLVSLSSYVLDNFTNLTVLNISGWSNVTSLSVTNAALTSASVNNTLTNLDFFGLSNGTIALEGGTSATTNAAGSSAKVSLVGKGWTVTHN